MADEAQFRVGINILKQSTGGATFLDFRSSPSGFNMDVAGTKGPTPGSITVTPQGVDVLFEELTTPTICWLWNHDDTNDVHIGVRNPGLDIWMPLLKLPPGKGYPIILSEWLGQQYGSGAGTGTGTTGMSDSVLHLKSYNQNCNVFVGAFEL